MHEIMVFLNMYPVSNGILLLAKVWTAALTEAEALGMCDSLIF
jgi:hypothetical protein